MKQLKKLWKKWIEIGEWIGDKVSVVVLSIIYIILILPLSIFYKLDKEEKVWIKRVGETDENSQF